MSLRSVNLNLLPILRALLRERNLSRAAESLGLTQPAVSAALTRLRIVLDDPILVRRGRGMEPTARAYEMFEAVEQICLSLETLMGSERFDPATTDRRFVIAAADYVVLTIAPMIISAVTALAPNASLHFVDIPHPAIELHTREVDFWIVPEFLFEEGQFPPLNRKRLIDDEFVTVAASDPRRANTEGAELTETASMRYIIYYPALSILDLTLVDAIKERTRGGHIVAQIQQFSLLPIVAMETGCETLVPRRIAQYMSQFMPITIIENGPVPVPLNLSLGWDPSIENEPAHHWLRNLIIHHCLELHHVTPSPGRQY